MFKCLCSTIESILRQSSNLISFVLFLFISFHSVKYPISFTSQYLSLSITVFPMFRLPFTIIIVIFHILWLQVSLWHFILLFICCILLYTNIINVLLWHWPSNKNHSQNKNQTKWRSEKKRKIYDETEIVSHILSSGYVVIFCCCFVFIHFLLCVCAFFVVG